MNLAIWVQVSAQLSSSVAADACASDPKAEKGGTNSDESPLVILKRAVTRGPLDDVCTDAGSWGAKDTWKALFSYTQIRNCKASFAARLDIHSEKHDH